MGYIGMKSEKKATEAVASIIDRTFSYIILACLFVHILYLGIFIYLGFKLFIVVNIFSVMIYFMLYIRKFHLSPNTHFFMLNFETSVHMILAVLFFGWDFGFQFFFVFLFTAIFMKVLNNIKFLPLYGVSHALFFITLRVLTYLYEPFYPRITTPDITHVIYLANVCVFFGGAYILARTINDSNLLYRALLSRDNKELEEQAQEDYLTGLANRRSLYSQFEYLVNNAKEDFSYCVAIGDIDDFKQINDQWGHEIGDAILVNMSDVIRRMVRDDDIVCRWGGEEIVIVMPNMPRHLAYERIERIREKIEKVCVQSQSERIYETITFGVCSNRGEMNLEKVVSKADELLYQGKKNGKNQVVKEAEITTI